MTTSSSPTAFSCRDGPTLAFRDTSDTASLTTTGSIDNDNDSETYYLSNGKLCPDQLNNGRPRTNIEDLAERLFSLEHLKLILSWAPSFARFRTFLSLYRPDLAITLRKYLDIQKALSAVKYANTLAESVWPGLEAAVVQKDFQSRLINCSERLLNEALPGYITYQATELVSDVLVKEITGQSIPALNDMVNGLAEVYCLTDPRLEDNPIVYASEDFYRTTLYSPEETIGKNCRFLQGPMTSSGSVSRIIDALADGRDICEVILNYRRDGTPFLNLLIIAPLYDSSNKVRFHLGAQIDINGVFEEGRGLQSLAQLLARDRSSVETPQSVSDDSKMPNVIEAITDLGRLLTDGERHAINKGDSQATARFYKGNRRRISAVEVELNRTNSYSSQPGSGGPEYSTRPGSSGVPNGKLVGVFQNYILVSPYPSLRIVFVSPSLNSTAVINSPLLSRVRGPRKLRQSVEAALSAGECFTAKISWLSEIGGGNSSSSPSSGNTNTNTTTSAARAGVDEPRTKSPGNGDKAATEHPGCFGVSNGGAPDDWMVDRRMSIIRRHSEQHGKLTWMHCTPLFDGKNRIGVWMCVLIRDIGGQAFGDMPGDISFHRGEKGGSR